MALRLFNTLTRKKDEFIPLKKGEAGVYSCGPTVYDFVHLGNLRAFIASDILVRYLKYKGYKVTQVMNITDVDDKTIRGAQAEGVSLNKFSEKYTQAFFDDLKTLNVMPADVYPKATDHIKEMVELVKKIQAKGHTYRHDGSIYFRISSFPEYGCLAHLNFEELVENAQGRLDSDSYEKQSARDFVLWKSWKPSDGEVFWETELGKGRPGWHIECSAMSMKYLGESFDIHTGGVDLVFPHHTNEIAQSEAATGKPFVKYWFHNEYLQVEGQKMSKSLGNFFTLRSLLDKGTKPMAIRYELMAANYKMPLNFTMKGLKASEQAIERLNTFVFELKNAKSGLENPQLKKLMRASSKGFEEAMDDNLNISKALGYIFDFVRDAYKLGFSDKDAADVLQFLKKLNQVLGVISFEDAEELSEHIGQLIKQRDEARSNKKWDTADIIRDQLAEKGIELFDSPEGTKWRRKS